MYHSTCIKYMIIYIYMYIESIAQNLECSYYRHGRTQSPQTLALKFCRQYLMLSPYHHTKLNIRSLAAPMPHGWFRPPPSCSRLITNHFAKTPAPPGMFLHKTRSPNATAASLRIAACHSTKNRYGSECSCLAWSSLRLDSTLQLLRS